MTARALALVLALSAPVRADPPKSSPPKQSRITPLQAAQLDAALAHVMLIEVEAARAKAPHVARLLKICAAGGFSLDDLLRHRVEIDPDTGLIRRSKPPEDSDKDSE
jgi:hypothetical protein